MFELLVASEFDRAVFTKLERIADAPFNLHSKCVVAYGTGMFVMGGYGAPGMPNNQPTTANFFYDVKAGTWPRMADAPETLVRSPGCLHNGLIWVIGESKLMSYDPATNAWTIRFNMPFNLKSSCLIPHGDYLYFFGGEQDATVIVETLRRYHIPSATIETVQVPGVNPIGVAYFGAAKLDGYLYVHGGYRHAAYPPAGQQTFFWRYSFEGNRWEQLPSCFGLSMHTHQIRAIRGKIITGGAWSNHPNSGQVYEYNIAKQHWVKGPKMTYSGWNLLFESVDNDGYLMGGTPDATPESATRQIWKLS